MTKPKKNPHAQALGALGGHAAAKVGGQAKGGRKRARKLTAEQRSAIARKGGLAGGNGRGKKQPPTT